MNNNSVTKIPWEQGKVAVFFAQAVLNKFAKHSSSTDKYTITCYSSIFRPVTTGSATKLLYMY